MKKKLSIHDIARQLNVSTTTVSFVLNGKAEEKRISPELVQKILNHVQEVGYQPNMLAKSLRTGKSNIIGMLVEDISDPFFAVISRIVEDMAYKIGYKIFFASTENDSVKTKTLIRIFRERQVDAFIIAPPSGIEEDILMLIEEKFPVIFFDRYLPGVNTTNVVIDNFTGAYQAVQHLLENGYYHIGYVTLNSVQTQMQERLMGYKKAVEENSRRSYIQRVSYGGGQAKMTGEIKEFLQLHRRLDAVLFSTNYLVVSGLMAINELNLRITDHLAVISFDDNKHFRLLRPSLTVVSQPLQEILEEIIKQLALGLSNKEMQKENIVLPTRLIVRESSLRRKTNF
jgi:LacI family transcriptional regulator